MAKHADPRSRERVQAEAQLCFDKFVAELEDKYDLTAGERLAILLANLQRMATFVIRDERGELG